ncbi:hypothetical protein B7486_63975, partial [cyanobacterium TDX16]
MAGGADQAHRRQMPPRHTWFRAIAAALALLAAALFGWCAAAVQDFLATPVFEPTDTNATRLGMLVNDHVLDTIPASSRHVRDSVEVGDD